MRIYDFDIWLANLGFGGYAVAAYVVKNVAEHTTDLVGVMISFATILGGLALAWYNAEKAWSERKRRRSEKSKGDK
jgi:fucose permease